MREKVAISACLLGIKCRYDGLDCKIDDSMLDSLKEKYELIPFCPEELGGLGTPRIPSEIVDGDGFDVVDKKSKVVDKNGRDVTEYFLKGATKALEILKDEHIGKVILKDKSPACGFEKIYDGAFLGNLQKGVGVATAVFLREGIEIVRL